MTILLPALILADAMPDAPLPPEVGDLAPPFELDASDEKQYNLGQYLARSAVVLAWFPKAMTPG